MHPDDDSTETDACGYPTGKRKTDRMDEINNFVWFCVVVGVLLAMAEFPWKEVITQ